jgi:NTP pyrophosphatase (non-canonical NTP hydrolase)
MKTFGEANLEAKTMIAMERNRQEVKWGEQNHDPFTYLTILMEEVGELSQAALHSKFGGEAAGGLLNEAVQTAAVAQAIVECLLRDTWIWPKETP